MALIINNLELDNGLSAQSVYAHIDGFDGTKNGMQISLNYYLNQEARNSGKAFLIQRFFSFTPSVDDGSDNFIKQGYEYLKTLPEFENAVDA